MEATILFRMQGAQNHPKKFETNPLPTTPLKWIIWAGKTGMDKKMETTVPFKAKG